MDNPQLELAKKIIENTDTHLFLTGRAGTGKTTFLRKLAEKKPKRMVVLAPTGIAALNAKGTTIHSFFQLPFSPFVPGTTYKDAGYTKINKQKTKLIKSLDLVVIDEISMVRSDLLDAIDDRLRKVRQDRRPFGGVQLLMIGDLHQLSPVVKDEEWSMLKTYYDTPYFFSSRALKNSNYVAVELETVYRQSDAHFLSILNSVREGERNPSVLAELNRRYVPDFQPKKEEGYIQLVTHNYQAQIINNKELELIDSPSFVYDAKITGKFPEMSYPTDNVLALKRGAQVMFIKNDPQKRYYNGMIAKIVEITNSGFTVRPIHSSKGGLIEVCPDEWQNTRYGLNEETKEVTEVVDGVFKQFPVKLAWAITIHKSQGLTFDKVMIDASGAFAHGQTYVALSRCRTLEGIVLTSNIPSTAIISDKSVDSYSLEMQSRTVDEAKLNVMIETYGVHLLSDLFNFESERIALSSLLRLMQEHLYSIYNTTVSRVEDALQAFDLKVMNVSGIFYRQYQQLLQTTKGDTSDVVIQERVKKGACYFEERLIGVCDLIEELHLDIDNSQIRVRYNEYRQELLKQLRSHLKLLGKVAEEGFEIKDFLQFRAKLLIESEDERNADTEKKSTKAKKKEKEKMVVPTEVSNPALYYRLKNWRLQKSRDLEIPAYSVLQTKSMIVMANYAPTDLSTLAKVPNFGKVSLEKYGKEILQIISQYLKDKAEDKVEDVEAVDVIERPGESSQDTTLRLYHEGKTIDDIAQLRELSRRTIFVHLEMWYDKGEGNVQLDDLVPQEHFSRIEHFFKTNKGASKINSSNAQESIGKDVPTYEIDFVKSKLNIK